MPVQLRITAEGREQIAAALRLLQGRVADLRPVFDELGAGLVAGTLDRFERQEGPDGKPWRELADATLIRRAGGMRAFRKGSNRRTKAVERLAGAQILIDSGRLMRSITHRAGRDRVEVGTNLVYGAIHQLGGKAGRNRAATIPARPYLGVSAGDAQAALKLLADHLARGLR
jgi:phage virion morphogenesis protein